MPWESRTSCLRDRPPKGGRITTDQEQIRRATNNQAEYKGLIAGLQRARTENFTSLFVQGDSELVIRQMSGEYDVNSANIDHLHQEASKLASGFAEIRFDWIQREENTRADNLAQKALTNDSPT